jgi:catechol 2,3-dioxygenase-like lactoylglutathione lyase family enzyme
MLRADHVVFPVWKPAESLAFYTTILRLPLVQAFEGDDWGGKPWLMMIFGLADGRELVLVALRGAGPPPDDGLARDTRHYAFSVDDPADLQAIRQRLGAAGLEHWTETHGPRVSLYFPDPNGVILEITTPPSAPAQVEDPAAMAAARAWIAQHPA